jgi:WD40 repeat protein
MRLLAAQSGHIEVLAYAPDGSRLAASARPGPTVWLWDLRTGDALAVKRPRDPAPFQLAPPPDLLAPLAWSPSGDLLAGGGERQVLLRDTRTGVARYFQKAATHQSHCMAFTPDGQTLVSAGVDHEGGRRLTVVVLFDVATGNRRKLPVPYPLGTTILAVSGDASLLLWCEPPERGQPAQLTLWHVIGRRKIAQRGLAVSPACAAFSPSSRQIALGVDDLVLVYEIGHVVDYFGSALGSNLWGSLTLPFWWKRFGPRLPPLGSPKKLEGHHGGIAALAYAPDGRSLFSGGRDLTVRCWDLASARVREAWSWPVGDIGALAVAPDGMTAAVAGENGRAVIWDLTWF